MRIVFVRHGEPNYEKDCLTEQGKIQAQQLVDRLRREGIEEIWASPMGRAQETADPTAKALGLPVHTLDFMHEVYWGSIDSELPYQDGHPWDSADEMARKGINLNSTDWRESEYFRTNRVLECVDTVEKGIDEWLEKFGYVREGYYYRHTVAEESHRTIALFSHGGSSAAAMGHILNMPFPYACALFHLNFTGITTLRFGKEEGPGTLPSMELVNDTGHLR